MDDEVKEFFDNEDEIVACAKKTAELLRNSKRTVCYTGAGVSTAAKIPDYRGPNGVWTLRDQGKTPSMKIRLEQAIPTFTHMALVSLVREGLVEHVVSTNLDGLHVRSGLVPGEHLSELHGNIYKEVCPHGHVHFRAFDVRGKKMPFVHAVRTTGRLCEAESSSTEDPSGSSTENGRRCLGKLRDSVVNFGEYLPREELERAQNVSDKAQVAMVIGTSMLVQPACSLPFANPNAKVVLINLQKTQYEDEVGARPGSVRSFSKCDVFFRHLMRELNIEVPEFHLDMDALANVMANLIEDPDQVSKKYNCVCMAEDPLPPNIIESINQGFQFRKHVPMVNEKHGIQLGKVL